MNHVLALPIMSPRSLVCASNDCVLFIISFSFFLKSQKITMISTITKITPNKLRIRGKIPKVMLIY